MTVVKYDSTMIWSESWRKLADWYKSTFNFEVIDELSLPDDTGITFKVGNGEVLFWIGYHDQVKGMSKDPFRIMIGFWIDDVYSAYEELKAKGVEFIAEPKISPTGDYHVATAKDPEGNIIQLFS